MKLRTIALLSLVFLMTTPSAHADWRWAPMKIEKQKVTYSYTSLASLRQSYLQERERFKRKLTRHERNRLKEWKHWTGMYIPQCTWYGESGRGPEYAPYRYTMPNSGGSGAYGKYQFMPGTYHNRAKYHDWSALDQEIAARREYWANGTSPWTNCH